MYYYKKQARFGDVEPKGSIDVQANVVELLTWAEVSGAKWPSTCEPKSGFAMRTRQGRVFLMHAENTAAADRWIAAIRSVGANIVLTETQLRVARGDAAAAVDVVATVGASLAELAVGAGDSDSGDDAPEPLGGSPPSQPLPAAPGSDDEKKWVHKVVGGVVIKTEKK
jgi:hypothetical protein